MCKKLIVLCGILMIFLFSCKDSDDVKLKNDVETVAENIYAVNTTQAVVTTTEPPETAEAFETTLKIEELASPLNENVVMVYVTPSGKKYHNSVTCPGKNAISIEMDKAIESGKEPCKKCVKNVQ